MKKLVIIPLVLLFVGLFYGCEKDDLVSEDSGLSSSLSTFRIEDQMLSFTSGNEVKNLIDDLLANKVKATQIKNELQKTQIKLLYNDKDKLKSGEIDVYTVSGYDSLVPNPELARLLNINGEIMVSDVIYKISPFGTYFFPKDKKDRFYELYTFENTNFKSASLELVPLGQEVGDNLYLVEDDIYRYDTYAPQYIMPDDGDEGTGGGTGGSGGSGSNSSIDPDYDSFKTFSYGAQTWFGNIFESLFGRNKGESVEFNSDRRIKVNFYNYNYVFYAECGATAKFQKKNWIGWSETDAEELRVGWNNIKFTVTPPQNVIDLYPPNQARMQGGVRTDYVPGNPDLWNMVELWEWDVTDEFNDATPEIASLLASLGEGMNKPVNVVKNFKAGKIEYYFVAEELRAYNCEKLNKVFNSQASVSIKFSPSNPPTSLKAWAQKIVETQISNFDSYKIDLSSGNVYGCAKHNGVWKGVRVVKED
ncbi:hypothetical protein [uncultured Draconibacterium sp.]|uniref:hypothetical protein n=1 Tax=uncultured Draconibacterium sp. TaxID=1573823 RepID=UPI003261CEA1